MSAPETWMMLGTAQLLKWNNDEDTVFKLPGVGMDAISWMVLNVTRKGGPIAFIAFSGLSIIPHESTLGDLLLRICAAIYLRLFSKAFREFVEELEQYHLTTWVIRFLIIVIMYSQGQFDFNSLLFFGTENQLIKSVMFVIYGMIAIAALRLSETGFGSKIYELFQKKCELQKPKKSNSLS